VQLALSGDTAALKLCLERLCPPLREEAVRLNLQGSLNEQGQTVIQSLGWGIITPTQATKLLHTLVNQARLVEIKALEERLNKPDQQGLSLEVVEAIKKRILGVYDDCAPRGVAVE
jgi:hypothetical protein